MFEIHMGVPEMEEFWNALRMTGAGRRQRLPALFSGPNDMIVVFDASSEKADAAAACKKGESVFLSILPSLFGLTKTTRNGMISYTNHT